MSFRYIENPIYYHPQLQQQQQQQHPPVYRYHGNGYHHHYYPRQHQAYYHYPSHKQHRPHITHTSTGSRHRYYDDDEEEEEYYREYGLYQQYPQEIQHVPPPPQQQKQQRKNKKLYDEDGEPLTELEILALENAAKNEIESKRGIYEIEEPFIVKDEVIENDDLSSIMESLTVVDSLSSTIEDDNSTTTKESELKEKNKSMKKKRWPFSFLFKKDETIKNNNISPSPSTPILDNDSSTITSSIITENKEEGTWVFKLPTPVPMTPTIWIKFDNENQKKIFNFLKSNIEEDVVQFKDSHIYGGKVPIAVVPIQMKCYIPTDISANQITPFDLNFIPK